jgi:hypothetical protein
VTILSQRHSAESPAALLHIRKYDISYYILKVNIGVHNVAGALDSANLQPFAESPAALLYLAVTYNVWTRRVTIPYPFMADMDGRLT